jgi:hypothetical protein
VLWKGRGGVDGSRMVEVGSRSLEGYREGVRGGVDDVRRVVVGARNLEGYR